MRGCSVRGSGGRGGGRSGPITPATLVLMGLLHISSVPFPFFFFFLSMDGASWSGYQKVSKLWFSLLCHFPHHVWGTHVSFSHSSFTWSIHPVTHSHPLCTIHSAGTGTATLKIQQWAMSPCWESCRQEDSLGNGSSMGRTGSTGWSLCSINYRAHGRSMEHSLWEAPGSD